MEGNKQIYVLIIENSNQPIEVIVNATSPGVNVGTSKSTNFTISIKTIAEVYQDTTYHSEDVQVCMQNKNKREAERRRKQ